MVPNPLPCCPHCGESLNRFKLPEEGGWDGTFQFACTIPGHYQTMHGDIQIEP